MDFEKLIVWQRSKALAVGIYKEFAQCGDFGFKDQITRSVLSVPSNIAEGMERRSNREKSIFSGSRKLPAANSGLKSLSLVKLPTSRTRWLRID